jgi:signal transduction histidine kinase
VSEKTSQVNLRLPGKASPRSGRVTSGEISDNASSPHWDEILVRINRKNTALLNMVLTGHPAQRIAVAEPARSFPQPDRGHGAVVMAELEKERGRIARELHAGAGQPLAGIRMNLDLIDTFCPDLPPAAREALNRAHTLAAQALEQVRAASHRLHPLDWQSLTLTEAMQNLVRTLVAGGRFSIDLNLAGLAAEPSQAVKIAVYRCTQECLSNTIRHAAATRVTLSIRTIDNMVELCAMDNGRGFVYDATARPGIGLKALQSHAETLGGAVRITSDSWGTSVVIRIPLTDD